MNEQEFVVGLRSGQHLQTRHNLPELVHVANHALNFSLGSGYNSPTNFISESFARHANISVFIIGKFLVSDNVCLPRDGSCCVDVVSGYHSHVNASLLASQNSFRDTFSQGVHQAENSNHSEPFLNVFLVLRRLKVVALFFEGLPLGFGVVGVGDQDCAVAFRSKLLDHCLVHNFVFLVHSEIANLTSLPNDFVAKFNANLRSSFNINANHARLTGVSHCN